MLTTLQEQKVMTNSNTTNENSVQDSRVKRTLLQLIPHPFNNLTPLPCSFTLSPSYELLATHLVTTGAPCSPGAQPRTALVQVNVVSLW